VNNFAPQHIVQHMTRAWHYRHLVTLWATFNIRSRYSQMILGILWIVLLPLSTAVILTLVFTHIFNPGDFGGAPFLAYFMVGLTFWSFWFQSIQQGSYVLLFKMDLMTKIYFPREILLLVKLGEALVDLGFTIMTMLIVNLLVGVAPTIFILYVPLILIIQIVLCFGLMLFVSCLSVLIRDMPQLIGIILQLMFYMTPLLYSLTLLPSTIQTIIRLNPLTALIEAYRQVILYQKHPDVILLMYPLVLGLLLTYVGYGFFKRVEGQLVDYV
jgi:lipopolysaccharide transport system permease protein